MMVLVTLPDGSESYINQSDVDELYATCEMAMRLLREVWPKRINPDHPIWKQADIVETIRRIAVRRRPDELEARER